MTIYDEDLYQADSATTHIILKINKYFEYLILIKASVTVRVFISMKVISCLRFGCYFRTI